MCFTNCRQISTWHSSEGGGGSSNKVCFGVNVNILRHSSSVVVSQNLIGSPSGRVVLPCPALPCPAGVFARRPSRKSRAVARSLVSSDSQFYPRRCRPRRWSVVASQLNSCCIRVADSATWRRRRDNDAIKLFRCQTELASARSGRGVWRCWVVVSRQSTAGAIILDDSNMIASGALGRKGQSLALSLARI